MSLNSESLEFCKDFIEFLNESCSHFHSVEKSKDILLRNDFTEIHEYNTWDLKVNGKYFFTRNGSTVVAFTIGGSYIPQNGFTVLGAHTDSPCLRIKPVACMKKTGTLNLLDPSIDSFEADI